MRFNAEIHHRRSIRLQQHGYSAPGTYFITLCTHERECLLGEINDGAMTLSPTGENVLTHWQHLPQRFPCVTLDAFVVMPNHIHGIICINHTTTCLNREPVGAPLAAPFSELATLQKQGAASSAPTLGTIVRAFKSLSAIAGNRLLNRTNQPFWQRNYWERIIRNETELNNTREYILNNPQQWPQDTLYKVPNP